MKIVLNKCYGGFGISKKVYDELGIEWDGYGFIDNQKLGIKSGNYWAHRHDPRLIAAIENVGVEAASGENAKLRIIEIPDGISFDIYEYDGIESVEETHRSWY